MIWRKILPVVTGLVSAYVCVVDAYMLRMNERDLTADGTYLFQANQDAEESVVSKLVNTDSTSLEFGFEPSSGSKQVVCIRFSTVNIDKGSEISSAEIVFSVKSSSAGQASPQLVWYGEKASNSGELSAGSSNLSSRSKTRSKVAWTPGPWAQFTQEVTPDLSPIVTEVINQASWESGNAMTLCASKESTGSAELTRSVHSVEGGAASAAGQVPMLKVIVGTGVAPPPVSKPAQAPTTTPTGLRQFFIENHIEENLRTGATFQRSSDLEFGYDNNQNVQANSMPCMRFGEVDVPPNGEIVKAYLQVVALEDSGNAAAPNLECWGERVGDAVEFSEVDFDASRRSKTTARVTWTPAQWNQGTQYQSPNMKEIVQEITALPDWVPGQAMVFCCSPADENVGQLVRRSYASRSGGPPPELLVQVEGDPGTKSFNPFEEYPTNSAADFTVSLSMVIFYVSLVLVLTTSLFVLVYRKHPIIQVAQPKFCAAVLFGALLSSSSIPLFTIDDSENIATDQGGNRAADAACMGSVWLFGLGFVTMYGAMLVKISKVENIFSQKYRMSVNTTRKLNKRQPRIFFALVAVEFFLLFLWQVISPLRYQRLFIEDEAPEQGTRGLCTSVHDIVFVSILGAYHFLILIYALYLSNKTIRMHTAFSEGKHLRWGVWNGIQFTLIAIPILFVSQDTNTAMLVRAGVVGIHDIGLVMLIFLPKCYFIYYGIEDEPQQTETGKEVLAHVVNKYKETKSSHSGSTGAPSKVSRSSTSNGKMSRFSSEMPNFSTKLSQIDSPQL